MSEASGLTETGFEVFVRDCELDFSYRLPFSSGPTPTIEKRNVRQDIEHIASALFRTVLIRPGNRTRPR